MTICLHQIMTEMLPCSVATIEALSNETMAYQIRTVTFKYDEMLAKSSIYLQNKRFHSTYAENIFMLKI